MHTQTQDREKKSLGKDGDVDNYLVPAICLMSRCLGSTMPTVWEDGAGIPKPSPSQGLQGLQGKGVGMDDPGRGSTSSIFFIPELLVPVHFLPFWFSRCQLFFMRQVTHAQLIILPPFLIWRASMLTTARNAGSWMTPRLTTQHTQHTDRAQGTGHRLQATGYRTQEHTDRFTASCRPT